MANRSVLFGCESVYQLFNSIILSRTTFSEDDCDVVLSSQTPWRPDLLERLRKAGIFRTVSEFDAKSKNDRFYSLSYSDQCRVYRSPGEYFGDSPVTSGFHDILCFPIDHIPWMLHYHFCVVRGWKPEVHLYDEGVRSYTMPIHLAESQVYAKEAYGKDTFFGAIREIHLHRPELYCNGAHHFVLREIPNVLGDSRLTELLVEVFGSQQAPDERYVYLEDFFFADRCVSNDMTLFSDLAEIVGMHNIIVKRHPRDDVSRYAAKGFKEFPCSTVPWEVSLISADYSKKVLVSVSSTSLLTPVLIFDFPFHVISLEKMFRGENPTHKDRAFKSFMAKFRALANKDSVRFHTPTDTDELRDVISYLELVQS